MPDNSSDKSRLFNALKELAEQDPLIDLQANSAAEAIEIRLYGEIQKEIISDQLKARYGLGVTFGESHLICIERLTGVGEAVNIMDLHNAPLEYYATIGFRLEPGAEGSGIYYDMQSVKGNIPSGYHSVVKDATYRFLQQGLHGWQVTDCVITITEVGVCPLSISPHFRQLTPILLQQALEQAGTEVCQPYSTFELDVPVELLSVVQTELVQFDARIRDGESLAAVYRIKGDINDKHIARLQAKLPHITQGRGLLLTTPAGYRPG